MATVRFGYTPTHPGEVLKDEIEYRKISQRKLAEKYNMQQAMGDQTLMERLNQIRKYAALL